MSACTGVVDYLAYKLFFSMQCYREEQKVYNKALLVIPIFEDEREHNEFMQYVKKRKDDFKEDVENQNIDEMFPFYSKSVNTVIVYKIGKTMVQWLDKWRQYY